MATMTTETPRIAYRPREAADALGVSERPIYRMVEAGRLRGTWLGERLRIPIAGLGERLSGSAEKGAA